MPRFHRRLALWLLIVPALLLVPRPDAAADMPETFQNLQVLPADIAKEELKTVMRGFTEQLDVKCSFCHTIDEYHLDDNKHKRIARDMIRLTQHLREERDTWFPQPKAPEPGEEAKAEVLTCWMCHRGSAEVEPFVPDEDDSW